MDEKRKKTTKKLLEVANTGVSESNIVPIAHLDVAFEQLEASRDLKNAISEVKETLDIKVDSEVAVEVELDDIEKLLVKALEGDKKNNKEILTVLEQIRDKKEIKDEEVNLLKEIVKNTGKDLIIPAPKVEVTPQTVDIDIDSVTESIDSLHKTTKKIEEIISIKEEYQPTKIFNENGDELSWNKIISLLEEIRDRKIQVSGGGGSASFAVVDAIQNQSFFGGTASNGTRDLTSANTWYAVPSTVPTQPYLLIVKQENAAGTIRWGLSNSGTPSATNGNIAPDELRIYRKAGQVVYYASSTAGDDVNWTLQTL